MVRNDEQLNQKIIDNENLIYGFLNKYFPSYSNDEDIIQLLRITLWKCILSYDKRKNIAFSTYAYKAFRNCIILHHRRSKAAKYIPDDKLVYTSQFVNDLDQEYADNILGKYTDAYNCMKSAFNILSKKEIDVLYLTSIGYNQKEIGKKLTMTTSNVSRILKKIKPIIMEYIIS